MPNEADAELVVHANAVLPGPVPFESFKTITGDCGEFPEICCAVQVDQLATRDTLNRLEPAAREPEIYVFGFRASERPNHVELYNEIRLYLGALL